ncbi:MAG: hypothetical protein IPI41_03030 [Flavobacteriales bacterium]|nr:hypothetical protein [Flavobacteriales bacterium]
MKLIVDTNIVFSAVLNSNSRIARVLIAGKRHFQFHSCAFLHTELLKHRPQVAHPHQPLHCGAGRGDRQDHRPHPLRGRGHAFIAPTPGHRAPAGHHGPQGRALRGAGPKA